MAETIISYDKWINGKPYPVSFTICDICKTRYLDPEEAINCENSAFEPKFRLGDKVALNYKCESYPDTEGVVLECTPKPPRKGSKKHQVEYKVIFLGSTEDIFNERELHLLV